MNFQRLVEEFFQQIEPLQHREILRKIKEQGGLDYFNAQANQLQTEMQKEKPKRNQYILQSILLYSVTLSIFAKVLLFQEEVIQELILVRQCVALILLMLVIVIRRRTPLELQDRVSKNGDSPKKTIKRFQVQMKIEESQLRPGDFLLLESNQPVLIDGILTSILKGGSCEEKKYNYISVSGQHGNRNCQDFKYTIEDALSNEELDPFIYHDSIVLQGKAWVIVCRVERKINQKHQPSELVENLRGLQLAKNIAKGVKCSIMLPLLIYGVRWLMQVDGSEFQGFVLFVQMVSSLLLYLSYVNEQQALLTIGNYFFQIQKGTTYNLTSLRALEELREADIIVLEESQLDEKVLSLLSQLSQFHDIKIIVKNTKEIVNQFAKELCPYIVYEKDETLPLRQRVNLLLGAKFISAPWDEFLQYYLPLLQQMNFNLLLAFPKQAGKDSIVQVCSGRQRGEWGKAKSGSRIMDVLVQLQLKSAKMNKLKNCYLAIIANSCIELLILVFWACYGYVVGLNLNLLILYATRGSSARLMNEWKETKVGWGLSRDVWRPFNTILLIYYLFVMKELFHSDSKPFVLFLFLMANRLFRTEALQPKLSLLIFMAKVGCLVALIAIETALNYYWTGQLFVERQVWSILVLPFFLWMYRLLMKIMH